MANSTTAIVAATTIMPTSAPAIGPAGDTGDLSEPGDGGRDNAGVLVTGSGVLLGLVSMVGTWGPVLLLSGTVVPETKMNMKGVSGTDKGRGTDNWLTKVEKCGRCGKSSAASN